MPPDAPHYSPDEAPLPPVRTRRFEALATEEQAAPVPPYVPGRTPAPPFSEAAAEPWADGRESAVATPMLELEELIPPPDAEEAGSESTEPTEEFPLDAFIIPEDSRRIPAGLDLTEQLQRQIAQDLAQRLERLARSLRESGFAALLETSADHEPVDVVLAAVLSGYLARKAH